jgi:hypothetical protein
MDEPPNAAPVAANDSATVDEDGSVLINVLANDTDPDGDELAIDSWQYDPPNGTVTREDGGVLRYTPVPDFHGTDTFTYTVTDGRATATATVTVTVNSVNDPPVAFDDAFTGNSSLIPVSPAPPNTAIIGIDVLANDIDYDGSGLTVGTLDASGSVAISDDKHSVRWTVPRNSTAQIEFRYQAKDDQGALSDWATVEAWAYPVTPEPDPPPPPVVAAPDAYYYGDDPLVVDGTSQPTVMANDSNGTFTILVSHPSSGRVTSFGTDGTFRYEPGLGRADTGFQYRLFKSDGKSSPATFVSLNVIDVSIYDGQGGTVIREANERNIGAVTVANMNDTDADARVDYEDMEVRADPDNKLGYGKAYGTDEVDLMKVVVKRPANLPAGEMVTIQATHAGADRQPMWYSSSIPDSIEPDKTILSYNGTLTLSNSDFVDGFATVWLEARDKSRAVRDLMVDYTYKGATDIARATAVWSEMTRFHGTGQTARMPARPDPPDPERVDVLCYHLAIDEVFYSGGRNGALGTGTLPYDNEGKTFYVNGVEMEFALYPAGVVKEPRVRWDMSRSVERIARYWDAAAGAWAATDTDKSFELNCDKANDDPGPPSPDEISKPIGDDNKLYQDDAPGIAATPAKLAGWTDFFHQLNGLEFVRVRFDNKNFVDADKTVQGSRASNLTPWHSWLYFKKGANGVWDRPRDAEGKILTAYNELDQGLKALNPNLTRP